MAFPWDEMDDDEDVLLDVNPAFARLTWPLVELALITGVIWLLIGFIDSPRIAPGDLAGLRDFLLIMWPILVAWRVVKPGLEWLGERFVLTDRRIILRRGLLRPRVVTVDLRSVRGVERRGNVLQVRVSPFGPPMAIRDVPSARKVAKMVNRMT
ncbi:YdbT family protein [Corynebacterium freneyi]|uniref:PH domain-containing protein n=1 Tax=Corynebacterium freneyi TaxID=134034 RepID=UPI001CCCD42E|nr:PH domain-containing protein [Corynebacterium freneyi]UBI01949.1 PH domain-containing protein [Corynebacterium freneyi]